MSTRFARRPDADQIRQKVARQFRAGLTLSAIAADNDLSEPTVLAIVRRLDKSADFDTIGIHFRRVRPYVCKACKLENARVPPTIYKPCVKCKGREKK